MSESKEALGILTFLLRDIKAFEGFFSILEYYNRTGEWPPVPEEPKPVPEPLPMPLPLPPLPLPIYKAKSKVQGLSVRDNAGKLIGAMNLGEQMEVWEEVVALGGWNDRAVITGPGVVPKLNVWRAGIRKEE